MADLHHLLAIYVHAHQTGNSVPPHIDAEARTALAAEPPALIFAPINGWTACINGKLAGIYSDRDGHPGHLLWSADPGLTPPAPDPHEALAARPLLEAVARMGDRIGQHTVREITVISDRAAHWLAQNPPGQPVAIEPRGCPAPGACSCVAPPAPAEPDTDAVLALAAIIRRVDGSHSLGAAALAEAILSHPDAASVFQPPAPAPAADGEREGMARLLIYGAECLEAERTDLMSIDNHQLRRAAALLRHTVKGWQPISTAPKDGTEILTSDYDSIEIASWDEREALWANRDGDILLPAWWHPLPVQPEPPQGGEVAE